VSLFSGLKRLVKKTIKVAAPFIASAIPVIGPALGAVITAKRAATAARGPRRRAPAPTPGVGAVGPPVSRAGRRAPIAQAKPAIQGGFISGTSAQPQTGFGRATGTQEMSIFAGLGPIVAAGAARAAPAIGRAISRGGIGRAIAGGALGAGAVEVIFNERGEAVCPSGFHLRKDPTLPPACVRNRRMNFGNARAARRSVRRIKGARKLLKDIEKLMPKRTARARRDLPAGHSHVR